MAKRGRQSFEKRQRELGKKAKRQEKLEKMARRTEEKKRIASEPPTENGELGLETPAENAVAAEPETPTP